MKFYFDFKILEILVIIIIVVFKFFSFLGSEIKKKLPYWYLSIMFFILSFFYSFSEPVFSLVYFFISIISLYWSLLEKKHIFLKKGIKRKILLIIDWLCFFVSLGVLLPLFIDFSPSFNEWFYEQFSPFIFIFALFIPGINSVINLLFKKIWNKKYLIFSLLSFFFLINTFFIIVYKYKEYEEENEIESYLVFYLYCLSISCFLFFTTLLQSFIEILNEENNEYKNIKKFFSLLSNFLNFFYPFLISIILIFKVKDRDYQRY